MVEKEPRHKIVVKTDYSSRGDYYAEVISTIAAEDYSVFGVVIPGNSNEATEKILDKLKRKLANLQNFEILYNFEMHPRGWRLCKDHLPRLIEHFERQLTKEDLEEFLKSLEG